MLAKSPDRRCRQKLRRRMRDEADPETALAYFQVSVNIIEARNLVWTNSQAVNSYVVVSLGKEKYRTSVRKHMEEPCYKEYVLLEWNTNLKELQKSNLYMAVMEPRCCAPPRLLGQASIDLGVIWAQPNHQVYHKWAQLSLPRDPAAGTVGFLKVDVSIMCRGDIQAMPIMVAPLRIEENVLPSSSEQQTANYLITVYNAFGIFLRTQEQTERRQEKLPSTYVKVSFSGVSVKTAVQPRTNNPCYCELISITEVFPNICQSVRLEVCAAIPNLNQILASVDLCLEHVSHNGDNGFVPTFGPSLLHMYGSSMLNIETQEGPFYRGALLISLKTIVPYLHPAIKTGNVEPIPAIQMDKLWIWEDFCIFCPILEVSMLDQRLPGKYCGVAFTIGEIPFGTSDNEDFLLMKKEIKKRKLHYTGSIDLAKRTKPYGYLNFVNAFPVLQQATRQPGFRFRIYRNNLVKRIAEQLNSSLREVENKLMNYEYSNPSMLLECLVCAMEVAADNISKFFEAVHFFDPHFEVDGYTSSYITELDQKQLALQKEELEKLYHQIKEKIKHSSSVNLMKLVGKISKDCYSVSKKNVKMLLAESNVFAEKLKSLVFMSTEGWPDIVIWLLNEGSRFAYYKISSPDVLFSKIPELSGKDCGRIQTIYMKPLRCPKHVNIVSNGCTCIAGKVELLIWMGLYSELTYLEYCLPQGFRFKAKEYDMCLKALIMMVEFRVFIYKAKLTKIESMSTPSPFVRINVMNSIRETKVEQKTMMPVWDQVLTVSCMAQTSQERITASPPEIMVEVCDFNSLFNSELIGRLVIRPVVGDTISANYAPKLEWHDLYNEFNNVGHILMSASVRQVPETLVKSTMYNSVNELSETYTQDTTIEAENEIIEELPQSLKPKFSAYKVDVYWWGLREVSITRKPCAILEIDDLAIRSDAIADKKPNCNFPNGRISQTFEGHLDKASPPPLTIKLCDSSTFGRIIFLGTNAVKNPTKYLVDWLPKYERDASLKTVSFSSANFYRVSKTLYVKKSTPSCNTLTECSKMTISSSLVDHKKWPTWKRLFCRKEPEEDELVLLPVHVNLNENQLTDNTSEVEHQDWWSRFFSSQKERVASGNDGCARKIKIYNSELESQAEFYKFKDWCSTLKLYSGKKTGLPQKDEELRCGFLKAGIAIYRWPPPPDTVAVSCSGVDLKRGFFDNLPSNDPSKFLVRVYIVRGLHLTPKEFTSKCDPYVVIKCGDKEYGDRNQFLHNTVNPIFGRTFEFKCSLPEDYLLSVSLHDREAVTHDTLIGTTDIDLEDRIYSKHRGRVGVSLEYNATGAAKWRDIEKPSDILAKLCSRNHLSPPEYPDANSVVVNGVEYRDTDKSNKTYISASERKENICLSLLHKWHTLPLCGYHIVPEHVETRKLYNPDKPGIDQGKVLMWIDIFPMETGIYMPLPVDITPRKVEEYELRVIVWHVQSLKQDNLTTKKGLDLYVKAWIGNVEQAHYTDIHYNSINGEANFNWRMIFHFQYQHSGKKLIIMDKCPFTEYEERLPPILVVQVADSDADSIDEYIGTLTLDLNAVPRGSKKNCRNRNTINSEGNTTKINLFSARAVRSWWPLKSVDQDTGAIKFEGMIDLELHLLPKEKAVVMPVGLGRDAPFPLPEPYRRDAFTSHVKSSILESVFNRGGAEYFVGVILLTMLLIICYWEFPNITFAYFFG